MANNIDILISNTFQIAKYVAQVSNFSVEDRVATIMQFHTLKYLGTNPNATLSEVAKYLNASLSSATQIVERLHKSEFITRNQDEKDRRVIRLNLTEQGKEKLSQIGNAKKGRMKDLLKNLTTDEINSLVAIQKKMVESIQEK